ncbi:aldo-keto reductase [Sporothrix brasiliensis 5110]|uniref:Aldo-keto reductase n=1 Tax=Sporothrix brasiliensis 5110 TaxID=1398154 RepID=A0A0C2J8A7_9PEZI|nr:aldo-keto reductase [Sporothrix brasiliensis 5110]KIH93227.1 aldo-keto reductase [Sporothrix brasiliensis 5110]
MSTAVEKLTASVEATKVDYKRLGKSGLRISVPVLGAMSIGTPDWAPWVLGEEDSLPILKAAYDRGLNTWDTANVYSNGESERVIAKALKTYDIPRRKVLLFTKLHGTVAEDVGIRTVFHGDAIKKSKDYVNQGGLSRAAIFHQVEASLKRLETDYIDLLQIHRFDPNTPGEETMEALHDLVKSGKVRYIGASSMWTYQFAGLQHIAELHGWTKFVSMQNHYSLLYREEEREMNRYCTETGVGLIPWAPLARGHLARPLAQYGQTTRSNGEAATRDGLSDAEKAIVTRVQEIADKRGWTMSQVALAWINKRVSSPIVGLSSIARLEEATQLQGKELIEEEEKYLEEPYKPVAIQGHS